MLNWNYVIVHYDEIAIKGKNRDKFENALVANIKDTLGKNVRKVYKRYGKIVCEINGENGVEAADKIAQRMKNIPGIANFCFAAGAELDIEDIKEKALDLVKGREFSTFKSVSSRSNKNFQMNSMEIDRMIGDFIIEELGKKVDVKNPELKIYIEIGEKEAFIFLEKIKGIGGLPVGTSGRVVASLSGGIDSPVAAFMLMKRGCEVVFVHIQNQTQIKGGVEEKIKDLVKELSKFQGKSKLYIVPFGDIQKELIIFVPSDYRMIIYRRFMMRILNKIAEKERAKAIVTGDSVGQVASQTLENLTSIIHASKLPVFSPLIGMNKKETIELAKKIKTYEHSIKPYPDCCSYMIAEHPQTKSKIEDVEKIEKNVEDIDSMIKEAVEKAEVCYLELGN
jgi:thiamine biosynthesis protein ThiI